MHAGVEFYVHGIVADAVFLRFAYYHAALIEAVDLGLEIVGKHCLIVLHSRIKHHYLGCDACLAQLHALIVHCHGYICHAAVLYGLGEFVTACAITRCLEHAHHLGGGLEQRTEEVVVIDQCIEVHFHHGLVLLCLEHIDYRFEVILRRTFHKYGLGIEIAGRHGLHKVADATIECLIALEMMCIATYLLAYAYHAAHSFLLEQFAYVGIHHIGAERLVCGIAQHHGHARFLYGTTPHKIECRGKRIIVAGIAVGYHHAAVDAFYHIGAGLYGL